MPVLACLVHEVRWQFFVFLWGKMGLWVCKFCLCSRELLDVLVTDRGVEDFTLNFFDSKILFWKFSADLSSSFFGRVGNFLSFAL